MATSAGVSLVDSMGTPLAPPQAVDVGPAGLVLQLRLPAGRRLRRAMLALAATGTAAATLTPAPVLDSDGFGIAGNGTVDMGNAANAHWLSIDWGLERALVGVTVQAASATTTAPATAARVRMFSAGNWLPLPPRDMLAFANGKASARFPAIAASRLMLELQVENKVNDKWSGVLVPGAVNISAPQVTLLATPQPCHLSVAVGDDAPFFSLPGPLPAQALTVDGLARALNRFISDNPGADAVPLTLRAAAPARLLLSAFEAVLEPAPGSQPPAPPPPPPPREEQAGTQPPGPPALLRGRWCRPQHLAAQAFAALPAGRGLSAVELCARPLGAGAAIRGSLALHADDAGRPAAQPLLAPVPWQAAATAEVAPSWLRCELPLPAPVPPARWWALLRVDEGELLWYQGDAAPGDAGTGLVQVDGGPWMPLQAGGSAWLQVRLRLIALEAGT